MRAQINTIIVLALLLSPLYEAARLEQDDMVSSNLARSMEDKDSLEDENDETIVGQLEEDELEDDNLIETAEIMAADSHSREDALESQTLTPEQIKDKLPFDKSRASLTLRRNLFSRMDGNGNGKLSLAEIESGVRKQLGRSTIGPSGLAPVLMRAYQVARNYGKGVDMRAVAGEQAVKELDTSNLNQATVDRREFRILLEYIYKYAVIYKVFSTIDTNFDRKISRAEYKRAHQELTSAGFPYPSFGDLDIDNGGSVLFDEFAAYMIVNAASEDADQE